MCYCSSLSRAYVVPIAYPKNFRSSKSEPTHENTPENSKYVNRTNKLRGGVTTGGDKQYNASSCHSDEKFLRNSAKSTFSNPKDDLAANNKDTMRLLCSLAFVCILLVLGLVWSEEDVQKVHRQVVVRTVHVPVHCESPDARRSKTGDHMLVHFTGVMLNSTSEVSEGEVFDTTRDTSHPYKFQLGSTGLMHGWEEA